MSLKAINWMAKQTTGDDKMKSALFWLAFHLNDETGECFPSISTLQAEMEVKSDNTVRGALRRLREAGFISWERETKDGLTVKTNYHLHMNGSMAEGTSVSNGTSTIAVPQPLREGTSTVEGGTSTVAGGVLQPVRTNREIEQGNNKEENKEENKEGKAHASRSLPVAPPPPGLDDEAEAEWNDLTARAALEADSMPEDVFSPDAQTPIENIDARFDTASDSIFGTDTPTENQNAAERKSEAISKPKRRKRVALTLTELPIDWRIYCEKTAPELNPDRVWDDFSDFWQNRAKDPFCVDWSRTWQTNIRKLHALPNNDFRKAPQLKAEIAQAAQAKPSRFMTAQERYEAELDRLGQISDEEYYARIDRAGEEFVRRDKERAARLAQEKAKKEKKL